MNFLIPALEREFERVDRRARELLASVPPSDLFSRLDGVTSSGELIVRSAAVVEQTFGGITTRLWDDPFEWTLPEELGDRIGVSSYLDEVAVTRRKGFEYFATDDDLAREIPSPVEMRPLITVLLETLAASNDYLGQATTGVQKHAH